MIAHLTNAPRCGRLAEGGLKQFSDLSPELQEGLEDIIELGNAEAAADIDVESQEQALFELNEYVRIVMQSMFDECKKSGGRD